MWKVRLRGGILTNSDLMGRVKETTAFRDGHELKRSAASVGNRMFVKGQM